MNVRIATIVKDESDRFLPQLLPIWRELGEVWCMIDGTSSDIEATQALCEEHGAKCTVFDGHMDGNEWAARKALWDWVTPGAEWVVHMDADHCPAGDFRPHLKGRRVSFWVFDMWSQSEYRSDAWWKVRPWWGAVNVADSQDKEWIWSERGWHSGHLPLNASDLGPAHELPRECGLLHYGYATDELRAQHHAAYMARSGCLTQPEVFHAQTIIMPARTIPLDFEPEWRLDL